MRELSFQVVCTSGVHFLFAYFSICSNVKQRVRVDWFLGVEDFSFDVLNIHKIFLSTQRSEETLAYSQRKCDNIHRDRRCTVN